MGMARNITNFLNSINSGRTRSVMQSVIDQIQPTGKDTVITAYATGGQANARILKQTASFHEVTVVATAADSVVLPAAVVGEVHFVKNSAALAMQVFAPDPDTIDSVATGTGVSHLPGDTVMYYCVVRGNYLRFSGVQATEAFEAITADNLTMANPIVYDHNTTITAFATGGQTSATALTGEFNNVTTVATAGDSVKLPAAALGKSIKVKNSGAASLAVFPATGDAINALAANLSVNVPVGATTTFRAIDGTTYETNEVFVSPAPTTQSGEFVFKGADNAADHEVIFTNASHGQGTTTTLPDPLGATGTVVLEELTNTFDLPQRYDLNTTITAFATGGQASATALTGEINTVTVCATAADSVKLPAAAAGLRVTVRNLGAAILAVFPATGDAINALAANLSIDVPVLGEMQFVAVDATTWHTQRAISLPAPTTQRGNLVFKPADNAANYEVSVTNASHGQATVHTIPDPLGATGTVVLEELTNVFDLPQRYDHNTTITAFATGGQGSATALTGEYNDVTTCATAGDSVALPTAAAGLKITVKNSGAASLAVFPADADSINALAINLSVNIPVGGELTFRAKDVTVWETNEALVLSAPTTQSGELVFKAADNAADYEVIVTNASFGQGSTLTIPDPGATGTFMVRDPSGDFAMPDGDFFKLSADTLAADGSTAADAAALIDQITIVTGADGVKGVGLPAAADLLEYTVVNDSPVYAVKVWTVNAGNDVINETAADEAFILGPGQRTTFKAISATQWYAEKVKGQPAPETHFTVFDDFLRAAFDTTDNWITFDGTTPAAQEAVTVTAPEGQITMINGAANDANDKTVMSLILLAKGSLISLGKTVFEARVSFSAITGCSWGFGLGDVLANATEVANYTVNSGVVADDVGIANAISFVFDTDATTAEWQACSTNGGTVGNAGAEEALGVSPAVNTYQILRIEVDATGDARFYVNGVLELARATAVATTSLLIPYIWGDSAVDAQTAVTVAIDYIKFSGARPSSNA